MDDVLHIDEMSIGKDTFSYNYPEEIPILIICYNNFKYVEQMIEQLEKLSKDNIYIINNNSNCKYTIDFLKTTKHKVINMTKNEGHLVWRKNCIFDNLPPHFVMTDPDLLFSSKMPPTFMNTLLELSNQYRTERVGFALDISDPEKMLPYKFSDYGHHHTITTIWDSQKKYWDHRILRNDEYELYYASIDTTFCLFNKNNINGSFVRIAGDFLVKHLPWYKEEENVSLYERHLMYGDDNIASTIKCFHDQYLKDMNIIPLQKRDEIVLVCLDGGINDYFWTDIFSLWEEETFDIFDKYLVKEKQFLDIGAWIGTTCIYAMRKCSHVVCVEADPVSFKKLTNNIHINRCGAKIDNVQKAIYHTSNEKIVFGPNQHTSTSQLNDSMSQIKVSSNREEDIEVETITIHDIINTYNLNDLCLIKIDIEGGEEYILKDLENYIGKIPVYLSFHHSWWENKDLSRVPFLTQEHIKQIHDNPFTSIFFNKN